MNFKREDGRGKPERLSIYQNPLTWKVNMILTKSDPYNFQLVTLKHIGWRRDEEDEQRFTYELAGRKNKILQKLKLVVARTLFEVIDKYQMKAELKIVRIK